MTESQLQYWIDQMNTNPNTDNLFSRELEKGVWKSVFWTDDPRNPNTQPSYHKAYFIQNVHNQFVACVIDACSDLHWYCNEAERGKGIMFTALSTVILPDIFYATDRDNQTISINEETIGTKNAAASKALALRLGFTEIESVNDKKYFRLERGILLEVDFYKTPSLDTTYLVDIIDTTNHLFRIAEYYKSKADLYYGTLQENDWRYEDLKEAISYFLGGLEEQFDNNKL